MRRSDLVASAGHERECPGGAEPAAEEAEQVERGVVGPVHLLEDHDGGSLAERVPEVPEGAFAGGTIAVTPGACARGYRAESMTIDFAKGRWINAPHRTTVTTDAVEIVTEPHTDLWQRTYYGFRADDAAALLVTSDGNFTFTVKASFAYRRQFDQCGVIVYVDGETWCKASVELEDAALSRLGSVVTNGGHSDWATTDIATPSAMWYRLSRRGPDFLIEASADGQDFRQLRIFHLHALGETTAAMGRSDPALPPARPVDFGVYACSPQDSSFTARFSDVRLEPCGWKSHGVHES